MRRWLALLLVLMCLGATPLGAAVDPGEVLDDPVLEARARHLGKELRCLVCQNQSIDDSDAELARDLRRLVREQIVAGKSDAEIITFLTARYGDFVLLKPPMKPATWGLWFGPLLVLAVAGAGLIVFLRRRGQSVPDGQAPLDEAERARLEALLAEREGAARAGRQ